MDKKKLHHMSKVRGQSQSRLVVGEVVPQLTRTLARQETATRNKGGCNHMTCFCGFEFCFVWYVRIYCVSTHSRIPHVSLR